MNFHECKKRTIKWAEKVGIFKFSSEEAQIACFLEEVGEVITAETREQKASEIGDCAVTIINCDHFQKRSMDTFEKIDFKNCMHPLSWSAQAVLMRSYDLAMKELIAYANCNNFDFIECWEKALNKIEKRQAMIFEKGGKCVKVESMTPEQLEIFKKESV